LVLGPSTCALRLAFLQTFAFAFAASAAAAFIILFGVSLAATDSCGRLEQSKKSQKKRAKKRNKMNYFFWLPRQ